MLPASFVLHQRLEADTIPIGDLPLSAALLLNDARFPWLVLVPRRPDLIELTDLTDADAATLMEEVRAAIGVMREVARPDKINVGTLGNIVPQLHVHVVARFRSDPAWPNPVWGFGVPRPYPDHAAAAFVERLAGLFAAA